MRNFITFIGNSIYKGLKGFLHILQNRIFLLIGTLIMWGIPIYMLNSSVGLTKDVSQHAKLTFVGIIVVFVVGLVAYLKTHSKLANIKPKRVWHLVMQILGLALMLAIPTGAFAFVLEKASIYIVALRDWWLVSLVFIGIGFGVCQIDRVIQYNKKKEVENNEEREVKVNNI